MDVTGKIVEWVNNGHIVLENSCEEKYYIGINSSISQLQVGNTFTVKIYPRYTANKIKNNSNGEYKFLFYIINDSKNSLGLYSYFYFFINRYTNEIISITLNDILNDGIIGDYYDLVLVKNYVVRNILPFLPENKNNLYTKVLLTQKVKDKKYYGYIGDEQVYLSSEQIIFDTYLGKFVWMELQKKYLSTNIFPGKNNFKPSKGDFEVVINYGNQYYMKQLDKTNPINQPLRVLDGLYKINSNNTGKIINLNYYKIKVILIDSFQITNNKSDNELLQIYTKQNLNYTINLFKLGSSNEIIATNNTQEFNLNDKLGSFFKFDYKQLYYLAKLSYSNNPETYYTLSAILINGTYVFTKNKEEFFVNLGNFTIAESSVGKNFDLELKEYYITDFVNNVIDI